MDNNRDKYPVDEIIEKLSKKIYIPKEHRILIYEAINEAYNIGFDEGSEKYRDKALQMLNWQNWMKYL